MILAAACLMLPLLPASRGAGAAEEGVSAARFARLKRGINTSHWFSQVAKKDGYTADHFLSHTTATDIALIRSMGFDHIRFSIEPAPMFNREDPAAIPVEYLGYVDRAIDMILSAGLAVVVDIHPSDEFKKRLADNNHVEAFAKFWRALARHLSARDPERVFLEVINEPMVEDGYRWMGIQARVIRAMREGAPRHTIIATAHRWSGPAEIVQLEPVADRNVVYNFHFYEPHIFTHQGATWGTDFWPYVKQLPYPSSPKAVADALASTENEKARANVARYGQEEWNSARVETEITKVADWASLHHVRVTCNEFGVYRKVSPPGSRAAWIRDVRTSLEKHGIGWAMWDYQGGFAVVNRVNGRAVADAETASALGLRPVNARDAASR
jgi:endoglucanase